MLAVLWQSQLHGDLELQSVMVKGEKSHPLSTCLYHGELGSGSACLEVIAGGAVPGREVQGRAGLSLCSLCKEVSLTGAIGRPGSIPRS